MRVSGNAAPNAVEVWSCPAKPGMAEVRIRENVREQIPTESDAGEKTYQYDEYILYVPAYEGLKADIQADFASWLETARGLETSPQASAIVDAQEQADSLVDAMAAMVEDVYNQDIAEIEGE